MSVKGTVRKQSEGTDFTRYVGFIEIDKILAVNPTLEQKQKLLGIEAKDDDEDLVYISEDEDGNKKVRVEFYYSTMREELGVRRYIVTLTNKTRENKEGTKCQIISSTGTCTWVPYIEGTKKPDMDVLPEWFTHFTDKDKKVIGEKTVRVALEGEEILYTFVRNLLNIKWYMPDAELVYSTKKLFAGNIGEIKADVINEEITKRITGLLQVETSTDGEKQYEKLFGKMFLDYGMLKHINNGCKFPSDREKKQWAKFKKEIEGEYGAKGYYILGSAIEYNKEDDVAASGSTMVKEKKEPVAADNDDY